MRSVSAASRGLSKVGFLFAPSSAGRGASAPLGLALRAVSAFGFDSPRAERSGRAVALAVR